MTKVFKSQSIKFKRDIILITLVPIFVLFVFILVVFSNNQWQQIRTEITNNFSSGVQEINSSINQAIDFSINIISNQYIEGLFKKQYSNLNSNYQLIQLLNMLLANYKSTPTPTNTNIIFYHNNYTIFKNMYARYIDSLNPELLSQLKKIDVSDMIWTEDNENFYLYKSLNNKEGFILVTQYSIPKSIINEKMNQFNVLSSYAASSYSSKVYLSDTLQSGEYIISTTLPNGKVLNLKIPYQLKYSIYFKYLIISIISLSLLTLLFVFLSNTLTKNLKHRMTVFIDGIGENENLTAITKQTIDDNDILSPVYNKFITLITKINGLHKKNNEIQIEKNKIELQYVQSQINPHLLYNSLSVIRWRFMDCDQSLVQMIDLITNYYRACISNYDKVIALSEELELILRYINLIELIQSRSYQLIINVEQELLNFKTFKHILQPFVENSLLHGIQQKADSYIKIEGQDSNGFVILKIIDNGIGIPEKILNDIKSNNYTSKYKSYGIKNTTERLKLFYGEESDIIIESTPNEITCVTIRIKSVI